MRALAQLRLVLLAALLAPVFTGCHVKDDFTINPDGSGKVVHTVVAPPEMTDSEARGQLMGMHRQAQGIEAWGNPFVKRTAENTTLGITGYFKNFETAGVGGRSQFKTTKNADGTWTIALAEPPSATHPASQPATSMPADMDAAVKAAAAEIKEQLNSPMMKDMAKMKQTSTYRLPGPIKAINGFKKIDDRTVSIELDMGKAMEGMRKIADDPVKIRKMIEAGATRGGKPDMESPVMRKMLMKDILGVEEPIFVTFTPEAKPLFDYNAEVAKGTAKPDTAFFVNAGVLPKTLPAAAKPFDGLTFKPEIAKREPKSFFGPRIMVRITMTAPAGTTVMPLRSELFTVEGEDGKYLELLESAPRTSTFGGSTFQPFNFEVAIKNDEKITKIKRVFGILTVATYTKMSEVDLGEIEMKPGAKLGKYGIVIKDIKAMGQGNNAMRQVTIDTEKNPALGAIKFYDASGKEVLSMGATPQKKTERQSMHFGNTSPLPEKATVKVTVYDDYKEADVPFELKDIEIAPTDAKP